MWERELEATMEMIQALGVTCSTEENIRTFTKGKESVRKCVQFPSFLSSLFQQRQSLCTDRETVYIVTRNRTETSGGYPCENVICPDFPPGRLCNIL